MTKRSVAFQKALEHLQQYKNEKQESEFEKNELVLSLKNLSFDNIINLWAINIYHRISLIFLLIYFLITCIIVVLILFFIILNFILWIKNMILFFIKKKNLINEKIKNICPDNEKIPNTNTDFKFELEKAIVNKKKQNIIFRRSSGSIKLSQKTPTIQHKTITESNKKTL